MTVSSQPTQRHLALGPVWLLDQDVEYNETLRLSFTPCFQSGG
jgi:hypothetical protein